MPTLRIGQSIDTPITLPGPGTRHRILIQSAPVADPIVGKNLPTTFGSGLLVSGALVNLDDTISLTAGQTVTIRTAYADMQRAMLGDHKAFVSLLSRNAGVWSVQGSVYLDVDATRPRFYVTTSRASNGDLLVLVLASPEDAASATFVANTGTTTEAWSGLRGFGGAKAWLARLAPETTVLTVTVADAAGNTDARAVEVAPLSTLMPDSNVAWNLPSWLPAESGLPALDALLAAIEGALNDSADAAGMLNPTRAEGKWLDIHGRLAGVERFPGEQDPAYRTRVLAVPRAQHLTRDTLEAHLTRVAGGAPVTISDSTFGASETFVRLDGSRRLDGTWQLGGIGTSLPPGAYLVRLDANPSTPLSWLIDELQRLRPIGLLPTVAWVRDITLGVGRSLIGARDLDPNA